MKKLENWKVGKLENAKIKYNNKNAEIKISVISEKKELNDWIHTRNMRPALVTEMNRITARTIT